MNTEVADVGVRLVQWRWWWLPALADLDARLFGSTAWSLEQFYGELAEPGRWLRLLPGPADAEVLGYVDVAVAGRDADLMTIAVDPSVRGRGWGRALLGAAMRAAADLRATTMFLEVRADNPAAELYRREGFAELLRRRDYYGTGVDALVMSARLPAPGPDRTEDRR